MILQTKECVHALGDGKETDSWQGPPNPNRMV